MKKSDMSLNYLQRTDVIAKIFSEFSAKKNGEKIWQTEREKGLAFAPTNIALCKYWGKRNSVLNLPITSSLSISLPDKGALTSLSFSQAEHDQVSVNDKLITVESEFYQRLTSFLDLFRQEKKAYLNIEIKMDIPVAAGLASSACGFASLVSALNDFFAWELKPRELSILARLGSGSASRSFWLGFVEWHAGVASDGMDSYAEPIEAEWPSLCVGILPISAAAKPISSREAMEKTVGSSAFYSSWPKKVAHDLAILKQAIQLRNFPLLAGTAESNALCMHATMLSSWPPISYYLPETIAAMQQVWALRQQGLQVYFTQDAGPNLKLLFLEKNAGEVRQHFPNIEVINVF